MEKPYCGNKRSFIMASETLSPNMRYPAVPLMAKITDAINCEFDVMVRSYDIS